MKEEVKRRMDHTIVHFEIPATDVEKLKAFYEGLFGWKIFKVPMEGMEYWLIYTVPTDEKGMLLKPGVNGGMFQKQAQQEGLKPVNYITIENIDESFEKVGKLGGKILMPKQHVPTVGWVALVVDPEGNQIGLLQPEQM
jgi:predicted enzyme related to lactoylglutathione lyase